MQVDILNPAQTAAPPKSVGVITDDCTESLANLVTHQKDGENARDFPSCFLHHKRIKRSIAQICASWHVASPIRESHPNPERLVVQLLICMSSADKMNSINAVQSIHHREIVVLMNHAHKSDKQEKKIKLISSTHQSM